MSHASRSPILRWIERAFVADHLLTGDPDTARRSRLQASFMLVFLLVPALFLLAGVNGLAVPAGLMLAMTVEMGVLSAALFDLRTRGRLALSGNVFVATYSCVAVLSIVNGGGLATSNGAWLLLAPLMALLMVGVWSGLLWLLAMLLTIGVLSAAHTLGYLAFVDLDPATRGLGTAVNVAGCGLVAFGCGYLYEVTNRQMRAEVERARADAERALAGSRLVLDHIDEGLLVVRRDGTVEPERSAAVTRMFGPGSRDSIWSMVGRVDPRAAASIELGWGSLFEDVLPQELVLAQLPSTLNDGTRVLRVDYSVLGGSEERVLVLVRDVTDAVIAERAGEEERQLIALVSRVSQDRETVSAVWSELRAIVRRLGQAAEASSHAMARDLHTLKGNAGILGLSALARLCHDVETRAHETHGPISGDDLRTIVLAFEHLDGRLAGVLGVHTDSVIVSRSEYEAVLARTLLVPTDPALASAIGAWGQDRVGPRLELVAARGGELALRLGKGPITVVVDDGDTRVPHGTLTPFFVALSHVVRNAVDHGFETPEERERMNKAPRGRLLLRARANHEGLFIDVEDDGRGVDWVAVAARAAALGLPHETKRELVAALFADGLSSRSEVTEGSGRGLGLAALRATVTQLRGSVDVESQPGLGCAFRFRFPSAVAARREPSLPGLSSAA